MSTAVIWPLLWAHMLNASGNQSAAYVQYNGLIASAIVLLYNSSINQKINIKWLTYQTKSDQLFSLFYSVNENSSQTTTAELDTLHAAMQCPDWPPVCSQYTDSFSVTTNKLEFWVAKPWQAE